MMKKPKVIFALLAPMTLSVFAVPETPAATHASNVTISWYVRANPAENQWEKNVAIPGFEKIHPNITVNLVTIDYNDFDTKLQTMIAGGESPDVISHWGESGFRDYLNRNMLLNLSPLMAKYHFNAKSIPSKLMKFYNIAGKQYGIPFDNMGSYVFYNKDLFKAAKLVDPPTKWATPSWTWSKMIADAKAMTKNYSEPGQAQYGLILNLWPPEDLAWLFGNPVYPSSSYKTGLVSGTAIGSKSGIQAFQAEQDATYKDKVAPSQSVLQAMAGAGGDQNQIFLSGKIGMIVTGGWGFWDYQKAPFNWGVAPLPSVNGHAPTDTMFTDPWLILKGSKHPGEAFQFIQYLTSNQGLKDYIKATGVPPADQSLLSYWYKSEPLNKADLQTVVAGGIKYGQESPNHLLAKYNEINSLITNELQPVFNDKKTAKQVLPQLQQKLNSLFKKIRQSNGR